MSTKITDLRGSKVTPIHRGSVCRAGGKPSTWFPPGTRRADHLKCDVLFRFSFFVALVTPLFTTSSLRIHKSLMFDNYFNILEIFESLKFRKTNNKE